MQPDEHVCLCFHVSQRKIVNFLRINQPSRPSQLSECQGAGTGCGWCVPYLKLLFEQSQSGKSAELPSAQDYAEKRQCYIRDGKGTPPADAE